jgi:hypothetical protein
MKMMFKLLPPSIIGLRQEGPVDYGVNDQPVSLGVRDVNPMIFPRESDWEFGPMQRLWVFGVVVPDFSSI